MKQYIGIISRFEKGLRTLGVLDAIRRHPATMREAFLHSDVPQTATTVVDLFEVVWSPEGTNQRRQEEVTHTYFRDFLLDFEGSLEMWLKSTYFCTLLAKYLLSPTWTYLAEQQHYYLKR